MVRVDQANLCWGAPATLRSDVGVLVLAGSSGRVDVNRVNMLAKAGIQACGLRWFGGPGLPPAPREVPLELFMAALDLLEQRCQSLAIMGLSYGAEAALLTAAHDSRAIDVIALSPTHVVWEAAADEANPHHRISKWTLDGVPLPYVPLSRTWRPGKGKPQFVSLYRQSLAESPADVVEAATIPVERISGRALLVAGGDDRVWPSVSSVEAIARRRARFALASGVVTDEAAGHPVLFPDEPDGNLARSYDVGGDSAGPRRLGAAAWPHVERLLMGSGLKKPL